MKLLYPIIILFAFSFAEDDNSIKEKILAEFHNIYEKSNNTSAVVEDIIPFERNNEYMGILSLDKNASEAMAYQHSVIFATKFKYSDNHIDFNDAKKPFSELFSLAHQYSIANIEMLGRFKDEEYLWITSKKTSYSNQGYKELRIFRYDGKTFNLETQETYQPNNLKDCDYKIIDGRYLIRYESQFLPYDEYINLLDEETLKHYIDKEFISSDKKPKNIFRFFNQCDEIESQLNWDVSIDDIEITNSELLELIFNNRVSDWNASDFDTVKVVTWEHTINDMSFYPYPTHLLSKLRKEEPINTHIIFKGEIQDKFLILFSSNQESNDCHSCEVTISSMIFTLKDSKWIIESVYSFNTGSYGMDNYSLKVFNDFDLNPLFIFTHHYFQGGDYSTNLRIYSIVDEEFRPLFNSYRDKIDLRDSYENGCNYLFPNPVAEYNNIPFNDAFKDAREKFDRQSIFLWNNMKYHTLMEYDMPNLCTEDSKIAYYSHNYKYNIELNDDNKYRINFIITGYKLASTILKDENKKLNVITYPINENLFLDFNPNSLRFELNESGSKREYYNGSNWLTY